MDQVNKIFCKNWITLYLLIYDVKCSIASEHGFPLTHVSAVACLVTRSASLQLMYIHSVCAMTQHFPTALL